MSDKPETDPYPWRSGWAWADEDYTGIESGVSIEVERGDSAHLGVFDLCISAYNKSGIDKVLNGVADFGAAHVIANPHLYGLKRAAE